MKNNKKGDRAKIEIELLLRKTLRVQQEPNQQLNDSIIRQYEKSGATVSMHGKTSRMSGEPLTEVLGQNSKSFREH